MGIAAYNRGSQVISSIIQRDYSLQRKLDIELMERCAALSVQYDTFSREAQAFFIDSIDPETSTGFIRKSVLEGFQKHRNSSKFVHLHTETVIAHNEWVNADFSNSFEYMQIARSKAIAWFEMLSFLNPLLELPFAVPNFGSKKFRKH